MKKSEKNYHIHPKSSSLNKRKPIHPKQKFEKNLCTHKKIYEFFDVYLKHKSLKEIYILMQNLVTDKTQ